jgi:hypothetical protein
MQTGEIVKQTRTLACVLFDQGRHSEALAVSERVMQFWRRVLPENHHDTGEGRVWSGALSALLLGREGIHGVSA